MKALKKTVFINISLISIFTILSRASGLLRDVFTASKFGATSELDVFFAASNIPMILFMAIGTAISTTFIPLYNEKKHLSKDEAIKFTNNVLNVFIIGSALISLICVILSNSVVGILNPGFSENKLLQTALLSRILLPTLIFNSIIYIFNGVLQSEENFTVPAMVSLPMNVIMILYLVFFGNKHGIFGLTIITFIATVFQILPQVFTMRKVGYKYKFFIDLKDPLLIKMSIMVLPVILGTSVQQINSFVERAFASNFLPGSLSALSYAYKVFIIFVDIFAIAISTVIYPIMSKYTADNNISKMKQTLIKYIDIIIVLIIPISLIVMVQSSNIIYILFERGAFTRDSTIVIGKLLSFYVLGLLAYGIRDFLCKAFYTLKDTKTPMINSGFAMFMNIVLIFILQKFMGLSGIALANAISTYLACILLFIDLNKKIGTLNNTYIIKSIIKTTISSLIMLFVVYYLNKILNINFQSTLMVLVKISISSLLGIVVFLIIGYLLNIKQIRNLSTQLKSIKNKVR